MKQEEPSARRLAAALWLAVGIGLLADAYLPCVRLGLLVRSPLALVWPLAAFVALGAIMALAARSFPARDPLALALLGLGAAAAAVVVVMNLVPPIARDELTYHLAVPALYVDAGRSVDLPFIVHAHFPMLLEMLYLPLIAHLPAQSTKYLHLAFGLAAGALVYLFLARRSAPRVALAAATLLVTTPTVLALGASAYVDLGLLFFSAVALLGLLRWSESGRRADLLVAALGAGCAAAVKYNGLLVIVLLGGAAVLIGPRRGTLRAVGDAAVFGAVSLVPLLPWLVRNAFDTGNPVYPLLNTLVGGRPLPEPPAVDVFSYRRALYGEGWLGILSVPLRVFVSGRDGDPARFDGVLNPVFLLGFAAALWRGADRRDRVLGGVAAGFLGFAFVSTVFRSRYVVPVLVPLALLLAAGAARWRRSGVPGTVLGGLTVVALVFNAAHLAALWNRVDPLAYLLGRQSIEEYVARFVPEYPVTAFANANLPADSRVYLAFLGSRGYYWQRRYIYDPYLSGTRLCETIRNAGSGAEVALLLGRQGITHIASADALLLDFVRNNLDDQEYARWQRFAAAHLRPLFRQNGVALYEVVAPQGSARRGDAELRASCLPPLPCRRSVASGGRDAMAGA